MVVCDRTSFIVVVRGPLMNG